MEEEMGVQNGCVDLAASARRALVVAAEETVRLQLRRVLSGEMGLAVEEQAEAGEALQNLQERRCSLLVIDLPQPESLALLEEVRRRRLTATPLVVSEADAVADAVGAGRLGAYACLTRPLDDGRVRRTAEKALREREALDEVAALREQLQDRFGNAEILTRSPRMHAVLDLVRRTADSLATVLIEGETGTGKELVARVLHRASPRAAGPLVAVNCAAVPAPLLASELFGHEAGAFTGAGARRVGRFEQAAGGTLFLDEVGEAPDAVQVALLRVLQERHFERVGSGHSLPADVRVLASSNRPLVELVRRGKFRRDLYYRLNVVKIEVPPLRDRPEDIGLLATHFALEHARPETPFPRLTPASLRYLQARSWPGNVRELENAVERACVTAWGGVIRPEDLPPEPDFQQGTWPAEQIDLGRPLKELLSEAARELERRYLRKALERARGHVGRCARLAGVSERWVTLKLAEHHLDRRQFSDD
jgi:DNA-binding NtrC family response regulator